MEEMKAKLQEVYAEYSRWINMAARFVLAFVVFTLLGKNLGYMHMLKSPVIIFGVSVVCAFLPMVYMVIIAAAFVLGNLYSVSLGITAVTGLIFLAMYVFYVRLAPKTAVAIFLMPIAFALKIPAAVPVAFALVGGPAYAISAGLGTIAYFMVHQVKEAADAIQGGAESSLLTDVTGFAKSALTDKEMWIWFIACILCVLAVYGLSRTGIPHAWKIASVAGAIVVGAVVIGAGSAAGVSASTGMIVTGGIAAIVVGLVLELFFFRVDYKKSENLQFEDDEYYYYVKAVPKVGVDLTATEPKEKNVEKKIIPKKRRTDKSDAEGTAKKKKRVTTNKKPVKKQVQSDDELLLTKSLEKDLDLK